LALNVLDNRFDTVPCRIK